MSPEGWVENSQISAEVYNGSPPAHIVCDAVAAAHMLGSQDKSPSFPPPSLSLAWIRKDSLNIANGPSEDKDGETKSTNFSRCLKRGSAVEGGSFYGAEFGLRGSSFKKSDPSSESRKHSEGSPVTRSIWDRTDLTKSVSRQSTGEQEMQEVWFTGGRRVPKLQRYL